MMDNFSAHLTGETRNALANVGCLLIPLPANSTSKVQILDVGVNKPFKNYYEQQKEEWEISEDVDSKIPRILAAKWIASAWEEITKDTIVNTARKIGFLTQ
jgi:hypothetical protein